MELSDVIAANLRRLREDRGLSLGDLARRCGLSKQTLSQVERGIGNPTVATLQELAGGLDVSVRRLVSEWATDVWVRRAADLRQRQDDGMLVTDLDAVYGEGWVRTGTLEVRQASVCEPRSRGARYQVFVISGRLRLGPTGREVDLSAGDFIRFPADVEHGYAPLGGPAVLHITSTAPYVPLSAMVASDGG